MVPATRSQEEPRRSRLLQMQELLLSGIVTYSLTLGLLWGFPWLSPIYLALWAPLSLCLFLLLLLLKEERERTERVTANQRSPEESRPPLRYAV